MRTHWVDGVDVPVEPLDGVDGVYGAVDGVEEVGGIPVAVEAAEECIHGCAGTRSAARRELPTGPRDGRQRSRIRSL